MNRTSLYSTNASLYESLYNPNTNNDSLEPSVIRPPIRGAYYTEEEYEKAVQIGINYARENNIQYIDHY